MIYCLEQALKKFRVGFLEGKQIVATKRDLFFSFLSQKQSLINSYTGKTVKDRYVDDFRVGYDFFMIEIVIDGIFRVLNEIFLKFYLR